ncbi:MAG: hypothetical protein P8X88_06690 [Gammaproteobacteria bacterium]
MSNASIFIFFFGVIGAVSLIFPKIMQVFYSVFMKLNMRTHEDVNNDSKTVARIKIIRLTGIGMLLISALVFYLYGLQ